jgi:hypothetical protein
MNTKKIYWVTLALVFSAWFASNPIKPVVPSSPAKAATEITALFSDSNQIGIPQDKWIVGGKCNIEYINDQRMTAEVHRIDKNSELRLTGWAMDIEKTRLPELTVVRLDRKDNPPFFATTNGGLPRDDVKDYFSVPEKLIASGYETNVNIKNIPSGEYALTLIMKFSDVAYICDNGRKIQID